MDSMQTVIQVPFEEKRDSELKSRSAQRSRMYAPIIKPMSGIKSWHLVGPPSPSALPLPSVQPRGACAFSRPSDLVSIRRRLSFGNST